MPTDLENRVARAVVQAGKGKDEPRELGRGKIDEVLVREGLDGTQQRQVVVPEGKGA